MTPLVTFTQQDRIGILCIDNPPVTKLGLPEVKRSWKGNRT